MNKVNVNDTYQFDVNLAGKVLQVNHEDVALDVLKLNENASHILHDHKSYSVEVVTFDKSEKLAKIKVNGNEYQVQVTTELDLLLKKLGLDNLSSNRIAQIKAPMPGLVLDILVEAGNQVKKGDGLVVLEAMKMENIIKSPVDAIIKKVEVLKGTKIEKNAVLIQFV